MGRPKNLEKPKEPAKDAVLENILKDLRNDERQAIELVKRLEGSSYKESEHTLDFCKSYAIAIIQTHCKDRTTSDVKLAGGGTAGRAEDKIELMLAACGLLKGFEFKPNCQSDRVHNYYEHAHRYNDLVEGTWTGPSIDTMIRHKLDDIAWELTNTLCDAKLPNGTLGLIDLICRELVLPKPRCIPNDLLLQEQQTKAKAKSETTPMLPIPVPSRRSRIGRIIYRITHITHKDLITVAVVIIAICLVVHTVYYVKDYYRRNTDSSSQLDRPDGSIETIQSEVSDKTNDGFVINSPD